MPEAKRNPADDVRGMIRVEIGERPSMEITDIYNRIRELLREVPDVRVEMTILPAVTLPPR
jgi:hypothetical protein